MKKYFSVILMVVTLVTLAACSRDKEYTPKLPNKGGIMPYELSESESYLLQSFGIENRSQIIAFNAPQEAITMEVNAYYLKDNADWESIGGGGISLGYEGDPIGKLKGTFTMLLKDNYSMDFNINSESTKVSYQTKEIDMDIQQGASGRLFLTELQEIEINKEIPVALMVYDSGTSMRTYALQDYLEPSKFEEMDLVQVLTLTFTDKEL
ncbi:hypothetical protein EDC19_2069 [Natranaerovirga hydrolytica]|uniref:Lipoprotein n=1 Tax=Natranaerovirga hydrolytica TaxID=680378 RepID=A0A4R1MSK6_9FIRM|nr:hypothetical protein [Natranaerovirga hydrolytica]TCK92913.1 hypothetical protein EDC19_2069 [Natranaerovirga hydrolytica]